MGGTVTYLTQSRLADNADFRDRVLTCCLEQALIFKDDTRREFYMLAKQFIQSPQSAVGLFELVCVAPNFRDVTNQTEIPDNDILAAVQANWPVYGAVIYPEPPPEVNP